MVGQCQLALEDLKLTPGSEYHGGIVNRQGYWDDEFQSSPRTGRFRVVALGHDLALDGTASTNCLAKLEHRVPGFEVYNFGLPNAGPRLFAKKLSAEVSSYQPDLEFWPSCRWCATWSTRLRRRPPTIGVICGMARLGGKALGVPLSTVSRQNKETAAPDYESHLNRTARHLATCRSPLDPAVASHWQQTTGHLDKLLAECRRRQIAVALVLVPGDFQVCPALCEAASRRAGLEPKDLDLDLPQRHLARFAHERDLPLVDLLPCFRSAGASLYCRQRHELNDEGNELATKIIAGWLSTRYGARLAVTEHAAN